MAGLTTTQVTTLLQDVLFENTATAAANAQTFVALSVNNANYSTASAMASALTVLPEFSIVAEVARMYTGLLHRTPDASGLAAWVNYAETGLSANQIASGVSAVSAATWTTIENAFITSNEFVATYGANVSGSALITLLYNNVLGRAPDAAGLAAWTAAWSTGGFTNAALVNAFVNSTEYQNDANPAIATSLAGYGASAAGGTPLTAIPTITPTIATATGVTYTLTTGQDTATANTFSAINNTSGTGASATLNAFDSLTGTAGGTNVLNINSDGSAIPSGVTLSNIQTINISAVADQSISAVAEGSWTGVTALNITQVAGVSAPANAAASNSSTVAVNVPSTASLSDTGVVVGESQTTTPAEFSGLTVNGGTSVTVTATASDANSTVAAASVLGDIVIGGTTAPTGAVSVTATETLATAASAVGDIIVKGGTNVTVNSTVNSAVALSVAAGTTTPTGVITQGAPSTAAAIIVGSTAAPATGTVIVNSATNVTDTGAAVTVNADGITINGGTTVTANETATAIQTATAVSTVAEGAVSVTGTSATTAVTVNQAAVATGALAVTTATAAITGVNAVTGVTAAPGVQPVTAVAAVNSGNSAAAIPVSTGTPTVTDGTVTIADAHNTSTATSTITSVTLNNYGASTFAGAALSNLSLSGTGGTLSITNGATTAATNTTLALAVNKMSGTNTITDVNNEITTLAVTTGASGSALAGFYDTGLKTMTVAGSSVLTLTNFDNGGAHDPNLTSLTVSGAAGLNADLHSFGSALAITTTSSGVMTLTLDDTTQTFVGSTGQDVISLAGDATKAITGGSATNNEVVLTSATAAYTAANFGAKVTGFTTLGVNDGGGASNTYNMHTIFTGFNAIDLQAADTATVFTGVAAGTSLAIDANQTALSYILFPATSTASVNIALNKASATTAITVGTLTLNDSNGDGLATANITSNTKTAAVATGIINHITTLADTSLTALNISGNAALDVGTISLGQPGQAVPVGLASFSITDNSVAFSNTGSAHVNSTIGSASFTDDTLGSLTFAGTNGVTMADVVDNNATNLSINNTGTGVATLAILSTDANAADTIHTGLSNLTFTGSSAVNISTLTLVSNTAALTFTNSGTATDAITALNDGTQLATTTSLTLSGNIALGTVGATVGGDTPVVFADTAGVTISAATDNAHLSLSLTGALATKTDTITVGNANDYIVDASSAGTVKITVGTGSNYIDVHTGGGAATYSAAITLGAHTASTGIDEIYVGTAASTAAANGVITGAVAGDQLLFTDSGTSAVAISSGAQTTVNAAATIAAAIGVVDALASTVAHSASVFTYNGNTYILESAAAGNGTIQAADSIVELVGVHTLSSTVTAGHVFTLAS